MPQPDDRDFIRTEEFLSPEAQAAQKKMLEDFGGKAERIADKIHSTEGLKALGSGSTEYRFDNPSKDTLETFPNPNYGKDGGLTLDIGVPEFTSLCPKTGQPDFAEIQIKYAPNRLCVESKSLKLYMMQYRNEGMFHEGCITQIGHDLIAVLDPLALQIQGRFKPRGGIPFWPMFMYEKPQKIATPGPSGIIR